MPLRIRDKVRDEERKPYSAAPRGRKSNKDFRPETVIEPKIPLNEAEQAFIDSNELLIAGGPAAITRTAAVPRKASLNNLDTSRSNMPDLELSRAARARLFRVEELLSLGYTQTQITWIINDELEQQGEPPFTLTTIEKDVAQCKRAWADRIDTAREQLISLQLDRYERLYRRSIDKDDLYASIRVIEAENKLLGLEAPRKVQVNSDLTIADITEERRQRAKEFFERRGIGGANGDREIIPARVSEVSDGG